MSVISEDIKKICDALIKLKEGTRIIKGKKYPIEYIAKLSLNSDISKWDYNNPVLIILDAVLTINRNYLTFVKPRVLSFKENYDEIKTIEQMLNLIQTLGFDKFSKEVLKYNDMERILLLKRVLTEFKNYKIENNLQDDLEALKHWAQNIDIKKLKTDKIYNIKGIGLSTVQYLRMLIGVNTMMPDRHIKSWVMEILGVDKLGEKKYIKLLEQVSEILGIPCKEIVEYIWALKNPKIPDLEKE